MKNERTANQAIADYNAKEYEQRQAWAKVLVAPAKHTQRKPVKQVGFFLDSLRRCKMKYTEKKQGKPSRDWKQARENKRQF